jgi:hypothetical protein
MYPLLEIHLRDRLQADISNKSIRAQSPRHNRTKTAVAPGAAAAAVFAENWMMPDNSGKKRLIGAWPSALWRVAAAGLQLLSTFSGRL